MTSTDQRRATITLPAEDQILITREFDAARHLVYRAYTTPELVRQWWCGERGEVTICEIDLRPGGEWRYVLMANAGFEVGFHGVYQEIEENLRIVSTEVFEGLPGEEAISTATFEDVPSGGTLLSILVAHSTQDARDMHLQSGMEDGMNEAFDRLEKVAAA